MNNNEKEARADRIHRALVKCAYAVKRRGHGLWDLVLKNGELLTARARLDGEWVQVTADAEGIAETTGGGKDHAWPCLLLNGLLTIGLKYALDLQGRLQVRAELPLLADQTESDIRARLTGMCEGIQTALHRLRDETAAKPLPAAKREAATDDASCDLRLLCKEAGWPFTERSSGKLVFALETVDGFHQAAIEPHLDGFRVVAGLGTLTLTSETAQAAVAVLLLALGGVVRMVRAAVEDSDGRSAIRLEVPLARRPAAGELAHALSALSVGCRLCGRELEVLQDSEIAAEYLAVRGRSSRVPESIHS